MSETTLCCSILCYPDLGMNYTKSAQCAMVMFVSPFLSTSFTSSGFIILLWAIKIRLISSGNICT